MCPIFQCFLVRANGLAMWANFLSILSWMTIRLSYIKHVSTFSSQDKSVFTCLPLLVQMVHEY